MTLQQMLAELRGSAASALKKAAKDTANIGVA